MLLPARNNQRFGYIDLNGDCVVGFDYDYAGFFRDGYAVVGINNKFGCIDLSGNLALSINHDEVVTSCDGLFGVKKACPGAV